MDLKLSSAGRVVVAYLKGWEGSEATQFFDEIANQDIKTEDAKKILDAYEKGADTEHSVAQVTKIDSWTCKKVLDIAKKHDLLNLSAGKNAAEKTLKVFLDDKRPTPPGWTRVYWPEEAIELLKAGKVAEISLDHDLGDDTHGTGYDVITWMEEATATQGFDPPVIRVHSDNSSARQKMELGIKSIERFKERGGLNS